MHVFISHAHADASMAASFVDLLKDAGVPPKAIFCTSLAAHGVTFGKNWERRIHAKLKSAGLVIALLSEHYSASTNCVFELGGAWALESRLLPLLLPTIKAEELPGFIPSRQCLSIQKPDTFAVLRRALGRIGLPVDGRTWTRLRTELQDRVTERYKGWKELVVVRNHLHVNPKMQRVLEMIRREQQLRPVLSQLDVFKRRDLPEFLERHVGEPWENGLISIEAAYDAVGPEVLLCKGSKWLWEKDPDKDWETFKALAKAMQQEAAARV